MSLRMAAWYAATAFLLVLLATGFLYWSFSRRISVGETQRLRDIAAAIAATRGVDMSGPSARTSPVWIRILDRNGRVVEATPGISAVVPSSIFPAPATGKTMASDITTISTPTRVFQVLTARLGDGGELQVAAPASTATPGFLQYREQLVVILTAALILCASLGYGIARSGMRPIERIVAATERIGSSTLHERIDPSGLPAELLGLVETFNLMLDRLEQSFVQLSQFSADLAHELRTPVGNLRGELEVALGRSRSPAEYREILGSALEECGRLSRIIQSLLFLARVEITGAPPTAEPLNILGEIDAVLEFYAPMAADAGVALARKAADEPSASVRGVFDRTMLQQALGNLVANAIAHTARGGSVTVRASHAEALLEIEVADTGEGIAPEHVPHVFSRFYRGDRARVGTGKNLGLGLAMVRAIAELHGGTVDLASEQGRGTRVTIRTPANGPISTVSDGAVAKE